MTTLISGGDSYIYGLELQDCEWPDRISQNTFPALLAKEFNLDYQCTAIPGYSNSAIARSVVNKCLTTNGPCAVIVSWTYLNRFEFATDFTMVRPLKNRSNRWYSISPSNLERDRKTNPEFIGMIDTFLKWTGLTEYYKYYTALKEILYLQDFLKLRGIPYVFTSADHNICFQKTQEILKHDDEVGTLKNLLNEIDWDHWFLFPHNDVDWLSTSEPNGFRKWSEEHKFPHGPGYHPLEEAHVEAFKLLKDKFNELVIKTN